MRIYKICISSISYAFLILVFFRHTAQLLFIFFLQEVQWTDSFFNILNERSPILTTEAKKIYDENSYLRRIAYHKQYYKSKKNKLEALKQGLTAIDEYWLLLTINKN